MKEYTFEQIIASLENPVVDGFASKTGGGLREVFTVQISEEMMQSFCKFTGDINPLHVDINFARKNGYFDKLVYGMLTSSFYSTLVGVYLPGKYCILQDIHIKFHNPVYIGDKLTVEGIVTEVFESTKRILIKATIKNQHGEKVSSAVIKVGCLR